MRQSRRVIFSFSVALLLSLLTFGCGHGDRPELGTVTGTVTLDGKPLANAYVKFQPTLGRMSMSCTDKDGHYDLIYVRSIRGAKVGQHSISISTYLEDVSPERIPKKYNSETTLKREVKSGENTIDFLLESK
jgi:hypothetical protein